MSRTDKHVPFTVAFTPDDIWWGPRQNVIRSARRIEQGKTDMIPWHKAGKHCARPKVIGFYARQENRKARHDARKAIVREDYDAIPFHATMKHNAVWMAG